MSKKTVQFKLHVAGEAPAAVQASPEAWIGADSSPKADAPGADRAEAPSPAGSLADAMAALASGMQESLRAGASFEAGPAADAMERAMRARTPSELAAAQADLARAGLEQGLLQMSRASRVWADAVARAAEKMGRA